MSTYNDGVNIDSIIKNFNKKSNNGENEDEHLTMTEYINTIMN